MTHIIHYVLVLTFSVLGLQLQSPKKVERINPLSRITNILQISESSEIDLLSKDSTLIKKVIPFNTKTIEKLKRID